MGEYLDREGTFRGEIIAYGLKEYDSGAVAINIRCRVDMAYNFESKEWEDWTAYALEVDGAVWVVKKDNGGLNTKSIENFIKCTGWNGSFDDIANQNFTPDKIQFSVKGEEYDGNTFFKINFVNEWDRVPGGQMSNVDPAKASLLQKQYASQMRAIAGNAKRATIPPTPATSKPPAPKAKKEPVAANGAPPTDDIPFALFVPLIGTFLSSFLI